MKGGVSYNDALLALTQAEETFNAVEKECMRRVTKRISEITSVPVFATRNPFSIAITGCTLTSDGYVVDNVGFFKFRYNRQTGTYVESAPTTHFLNILPFVKKIYDSGVFDQMEAIWEEEMNRKIE